MKATINIKLLFVSIYIALSVQACIKAPSQEECIPLLNMNLTIDGEKVSDEIYLLDSNTPTIKIHFNTPIDVESVDKALIIENIDTGEKVEYSVVLADSDKTLVIHPSFDKYMTLYQVVVRKSLKSKANVYVKKKIQQKLRTGLDESYKFPEITDEQLLDLIQKQTFNYFWNVSSPTCCMTLDSNFRENWDVSVGGTGLGIMFLPAAVERGFITRRQAFERLSVIVVFLKNKCERFHGAFSHRINGDTGKVYLWAGPDDDGGDILETSFLMMGLLTARQYFNKGNEELQLCKDITELYNNVEWSWYTKGDKSIYWLWSPTVDWKISFECKGWNETLITYVLAASSSTFPISKEVYENGWASNGKIKNGREYYGFNLPMGPDYGGWPGYSEYSFLGIDPNGLIDQYGDYASQLYAVHAINREYSIINPKHQYFYGENCWGFCGVPKDDKGVIEPFIALSALPYLREDAMKALRTYYYVLGDNIFSQYGFIKSFNLQTTPAEFNRELFVYDQMCYLVSIENYRTGLIWKLFTSCPEIQMGMKKLGFNAPYLN